jgi:acyl-CoA synthetase (AMP-forming)/AMP-acid ligase II
MRTTPQARIDAMTAAGLWSGETLHALLERHASQRPGDLAVRDQPNRAELTGDAPRSLSWAELHAASLALAGQLHAAGVGRDDTVLVQLPNITELVVLYYALSRLGAIVSPVPVQYGAHELQLVEGELDTRHVISLSRLRDTAPAGAVRAALPRAKVLELGRDLQLDGPTDSPLPAVPDDANAILTICWTSGTTGTPKGVPRSHNMWVATGQTSIAAGAMQPDDALLNPFPLVNMAGLGGFLFPAALLGAALVLHQPLDPPLFLAQLQDERITFTIAPPPLLNQLARAPAMWQQFDFSALRRIGSGSAPLAPDMIATFRDDYGKEIVNFYGSNEGISLFATPEDAPEPEVRATMFRIPSPGALIETRLADPDSGAAVESEGQPAELLIRGATVFDGYLHHDSGEVFSADGFFRTGDLVEICGEGRYYRIVGRCKDIINRGGMKISPAELDVALEHHPALAEAAVCAYPDERLGERVCACVVPGEDAPPPTLDEVRDFLAARGFASFKLPERLEVYERLPRNPLGKVQRFALQEALSLTRE